jgi:uncharacterized protein (DUF488 family)
MPLFTIGHSTHSEDYFLSLLKKHNINAVCDVRSSPKSRVNPQFDRDQIRTSLHRSNIEYVFLGASLGARPDNKSCYVNGKALYSLISQTPQFQTSIARVRKGAEGFNLALMCAEKDPITCHRTIMVCRYLTEFDIQHVLADGSIEPHNDSMKRLIKILGVRGEVSDDNKSVIESAYEIQGSRICYTDERQLEQTTLSMDNLL